MSTVIVVSIIAMFGVLVSAGLSAAISLFISFRASKSRVAEFRKEWIEDLRIKLSEYISMTMEIRVEFERSKKSDSDLLSEEILGLLHKRLESYIKLSLNPDESEHSKLLNTIDVLSDPDSQETSIPTIVDTARMVLKKEWDRLKSEI